MVPELRSIQEKFGYLPAEQLELLATELGVPLSQIHGVASFYPHFRLRLQQESTFVSAPTCPVTCVGPTKCVTSWNAPFAAAIPRPWQFETFLVWDAVIKHPLCA